MIEKMLRRPVALSMFYVGIVILGVISYQNLSVEGQPDLELPQLIVRTTWGSTSPEVVQVFLTSPIEEVAAQIEGIEELTSSSTQGFSQVSLKFNRDTDMEFARLDLNERLSSLRANLPPGAFQPNISTVDNDETQQKRFMAFDITGPYDLERLFEIYEDGLRDVISSVDGVAQVDVAGQRERALKVQLNRESMELYGLVPQIVLSKVTELTRTYDTPRTNYENSEYTIVIPSSIKSMADVENTVLKKTKDQTIRLKDVGTLTVGHAKANSLSRLNGNPTIRVTLQKEVGASVIKTAKDVRAAVDEALPNLPQGFRLDWDSDEGQMMEEQLSSIYERGLWCIVLIVILLLFFLQSASAAIVITLNILFSVLITINFMYYFDVTFNVVTLSGLAIGFGMLVDNAIVVLENIFRHRELGKGRIEAAILGVREIIWAIFAATLTTVAAFMCMGFLEDRLSVAYMPLAMSVIFSLSASLMVSFTFTPMLSLLIRGSNLGSETKGNIVARVFNRSIHRLITIYGKIVYWTLHHKMLIFLLVTVVLLSFVRIFKDEVDSGGFSFFFNQDDRVSVFIRMPEGAELETADDVIKQFEQPLLGVEGYKDVSVSVNTTRSWLQVSFDSDMLASPFPLALKAKLIGIAQNFAGVSLGVYGISSDDNFSSGSTGFESYNSSIRVLGYNYKELMDYGEEVLRTVRRNRRVKAYKLETSRFTFRSRDQTETVLIIDREALRQYDIDIDYLMGFLQRNLTVESTRKTKYKGEEVTLEVKFSDAEQFDIKDLESLIVRTESGQRIRLADMVDLVERKVAGGIDRKDQQYMVNIKWDYKASPKKSRNYNEAVFNSLELPSGFKAELDFDRDMNEDETKNLWFVFILAAVMVFMIIAALYESFVDPLVIFLTIPLSFIGVSWIYWFSGKSFDSTAYIGLIIIAGIVVNNSILLVTHINDEVRKIGETGLTLQQAVTKASQDRLRPILLTAITTVVGLLPLLEEFVSWFFAFPPIAFVMDTALIQWAMEQMGYEMGVNLENQGLQTTLSMFSSLSRSTVGGLVSGTFSTLLIIPVVYMIFFRGKQWLNHRINEVFHMVNPKSEDK